MEDTRLAKRRKRLCSLLPQVNVEVDKSVNQYTEDGGDVSKMVERQDP